MAAAKGGRPLAEEYVLNVPEALVFRPSLDEFKDPLKYIASIREAAEPYGICKIVPPTGWKPPCAIDKDNLRFPTRVQSVHELQRRSHLQAQRKFLDDYLAFLEATGKQKTRKNPIYCTREIDLYRFYRAVQRRGGYKQTTDDKRWKEIAKLMQVRPSHARSLPCALRICPAACPPSRVPRRAGAHGAPRSRSASGSRRPTAVLTPLAARPRRGARR